ncbi:MAG: ImmA/IrrE family metallo-endopeptidase [Candidatus Hydrogenedentes bacterium]|nr:ImmA/IrrE family metallo-endopeptidase [Candidatus Hydrogenedentota bacterium]
MDRVTIDSALLSWALERSGKTPEKFANRFPKLDVWLSGTVSPTFKQLEAFSKATYTPMGYFFLPEPPAESLPIPDFRTFSSTSVKRPSANLLDTLYTMQRRRDWLREQLIEEEASPLAFVGSARLNDPPESVGQEMRRIVGLEDGWAVHVHTWTDAVGELRRAIETLGVLVVINGVVGNNTSRKLDVHEFRGFALCDEYAPAIFVNGADFESAKMFTLAHELAHIWIGREGLSGFEGIVATGNDVEKYCDAAAAEFLVPAHELHALWPKIKRNALPFNDIARRFKVSPVVAARRAWDLRLIGKEHFFTFYKEYTAEEHQKKSVKKGGGDFYNSQNTRVGARFTSEVIRAAKEGRIQYREAYSLTGLYGNTFKKYVQHLGFDLL